METIPGLRAVPVFCVSDLLGGHSAESVISSGVLEVDLQASELAIRASYLANSLSVLGAFCVLSFQEFVPTLWGGCGRAGD